MKMNIMVVTYLLMLIHFYPDIHINFRVITFRYAREDWLHTNRTQVSY